jgi:hypothetical protein
MNRTQLTAFEDWNKALKRSGLSLKAAELSLEDRATVRLLAEEARRQSNRESVALNAAQEFNDSPNLLNTAPEESSELDVGWLDRFWLLAQDVSDSEMQQVWGRILARQTTGAARYSARALQTLSLLSRDEARELERIATFAIRTELSYKAECYVLTSFNNLGDNKQLEELSQHLATIVNYKKLHREVFGPAGIYLDSGSGWGHDAGTHIKNTAGLLLICGRRIELSFPPGEDRDYFFGGGLALSPVGVEILDLIKAEANETYLTTIVEALKMLGAQVRLA